MSYNDRINAALQSLEQHNEAVGGEGKPGFINSEAFINCLKVSGGTSEERLSALSHEDILACMPGHMVGGTEVKPRVLAKDIASIFRSNQVKAEEKRPISTKKADKMTPRELVESFDPEDYANSVGERLSTISRGEPFVVYLEGRMVDVETTFKLLMEIKGGFPGRNDVDVAGNIKKVYKIGDLPENYADENPLYRDRPLRPDGTCDQTGRSWEGVDLAIRQLIRVAMDLGELKVTHETAHDIMDMALEAGALKNLRTRYRKSAVKFDELAKTGDLPKLKIALGVSEEGDTTNFPEGKKVAWSQLDNAYVEIRQSQRRSGTYTSNITNKRR